jgi:hypothetical protein
MFTEYEPILSFRGLNVMVASPLEHIGIYLHNFVMKILLRSSKSPLIPL